MTYPSKGEADYLELGDWNCICSMCGRKRKASTMVKNWQGMYRCPEHNETRHPQEFVRAVPDIQTPPWVQPPPTDVYVGPIIVEVFPTTGPNGEPSGEITIPTGTTPVPGGLVIVIVPPNTVLPVPIHPQPSPPWPPRTKFRLPQDLPGPVNIVPPLLWERVGAPAPTLVFSIQPSNAEHSWNISPAVVVSAVDNNGFVVDSFNGNITLALYNNPGPGVLSGTLTKAAVNGVATFSNLKINVNATGYTLLASATGLSGSSSVVSNPFNIRDQATGGEKSRSGIYTLHIFGFGDPTPGYYDFNVLVAPLTIDYALIAGGGGAGLGGGGGGEIYQEAGHVFNSTGVNTATIGDGSGANTGLNGDNSYFIGKTVIGGGYGGGLAQIGGSGAAGGGGGYTALGPSTVAGGGGLSGHGGGSASTDAGGNQAAGGGGGAGSAGTNGVAGVVGICGNGGSGIPIIPLNHLPLQYFSGGGGGLGVDGTGNISGIDGLGSQGSGGGGGVLIAQGSAGVLIIRYLT